MSATQEQNKYDVENDTELRAFIYRYNAIKNGVKCTKEKEKQIKKNIAFLKKYKKHEEFDDSIQYAIREVAYLMVGDMIREYPHLVENAEDSWGNEIMFEDWFKFDLDMAVYVLNILGKDIQDQLDDKIDFETMELY